jgi:LAGLIDADG endonuclease
MISDLNLGNKKTNKYLVPKYVAITFQITLHINDLNTLNFIKNELKCGNISYFKTSCTYRVSDKESIESIIIPLFSFFHLNSSKYSQFTVFKEAAEIIFNKSHLTYEGLSKLIYLRSIINGNPCTPELFNITDN